MICESFLLANFGNVEKLSENIWKCEDGLPGEIFYYYVKSDERIDAVLVSRNRRHDQVAIEILIAYSSDLILPGINIIPASVMGFDFDSLFLVPPGFHSFFKGREPDVTQCLSLIFLGYRCEFSGSESADEFLELYRDFVPIWDLGRAPHPKIRLRFDNPGKVSGTGDGYVNSNLKYVSFEVSELSKSRESFVEITNSWGEVLEFLPGGQFLTMIKNRDDGSAVALHWSDADAEIERFARGL